MEKHYICTGGCGGMLEQPGVCQTEGCPNRGKAMEECNCADGLHSQAKEQDAQEESQTKDM